MDNNTASNFNGSKGVDDDIIQDTFDYANEFVVNNDNGQDSSCDESLHRESPSHISKSNLELSQKEFPSPGLSVSNLVRSSRDNLVTPAPSSNFPPRVQNDIKVLCKFWAYGDEDHDVAALVHGKEKEDAFNPIMSKYQRKRMKKNKGQTQNAKIHNTRSRAGSYNSDQ